MASSGSKPSEKEACEKCGKADGTVRAVGRDDLRRICADCYVEGGSPGPLSVAEKREWTLVARDEYAGWVVTGPLPDPGERVRVAPVEDRERYEKALEQAEKGIGSLLWVMNNRHNWADPRWDDLAESAEKDARWALDAVRAALGERPPVEFTVSPGDAGLSREDTAIVGGLVRAAHARMDVFSRPECVFNYCPHAKSCRVECLSPLGMADD